MEKGVALPINTVIILVLAGIVLVALVAMFIGRMFSSESAMDTQKVWSTCCVSYCHSTSGEPSDYCCADCGAEEEERQMLDELAVQLGKTGPDPTREQVLDACGC